MNVTGGDTNVSVYFQMRLTAGGDATGLTITDFDLSYTRNGAETAAKADVTDLGSASAAHTDNGGYEVDPTDCPGLHRFDFPDAAFAAGVKNVLCTIKHTSCFTETHEVMIDSEVNATKISGSATAADNAEVVYDTDFATNYNATRNAWATNAQDFVGTTASDPFNGQVIAASVTGAVGSVTAGVSLANGAITNASLAGNMEIVFETDFATNYNTTRNAWATNVQDFVGTSAADPFNGQVVGASITGSVGSLAAQAKADVNAEMVDVIDTDTSAEPAQGAPPATTTLRTKIDWLYKVFRNKTTQTATTWSLFNDAKDTVDSKSTVSDDSITFTKDEIVTGP
jgi:hypothetical protein